MSAQVVVSREKNGHRADVTLHARGEKFLHGDGRGESVAVAMAAAVDKLGQQARKVKGKFEGRKRRRSQGGVDDDHVEVAAEPPAARRSCVRTMRAPEILQASAPGDPRHVGQRRGQR